ncbi:MAG TPA: type II secretion system minor pseudopilin GspJ [Casimicrobiaceae bacterium]|nr:type II secretion system minor pseudopilin GspJ [Casimicrobiaceae bacterium]
MRCIEEKAARAAASRDRGFTLVEALVAVTILAIVALIAWRATAAMTDSEARLAGESARWRQLDALMARMEADMRAAIPRTVRHGSAREPAWVAATNDAAGNTSLVFSRAGPDALDAPGSGGQRVGYRLRDGRIEVLYWPRLDNVTTKDPAAYVLAGGVASFRVLQLAPNGQWSDRWPLPDMQRLAPELQTSLPRGVRVDVTLADGSVVERWLALQ